MVESGTLYVVATPIGNLADITYRAVSVLAEVDLIAAEDTRHSARLLSEYGIQTQCISYHDHNEGARAQQLVDKLKQGQSIALISDAGTPLINDPGYNLVCLARDKSIPVVPLPGPCALIAALSISGLPVDHFRYGGFLPRTSTARQSLIQTLSSGAETLVFYESSHRIMASCEDIRTVLGDERLCVIARELTKSYETIKRAPLGELCEWLAADSNQTRGEFVLMIQGASEAQSADEQEAERILTYLLEELPASKASSLASKITGVPRKVLYKKAMDL